jgi:hypothetical protein
LTDEERRQRHSIDAIARDRHRVWGDISDEEYVVAWSRRLVDILPVAEPQDDWQAQLQSARRVAAARISARDMGMAPPEVDAEDERNLNELLNVVPDIETHVRMVGTGPGGDIEPGGTRSSRPTGARVEEAAAVMDQVTGGRVSALLFIGVLGLPLGCAFLVGFIALFLVFGGAFALIGLGNSGAADLVALAAALIGAFTLVVVVYRKLIVRVPWLRRLVNR